MIEDCVFETIELSDDHDWLSLVIVLVCLLLSAFFAGSETALTASSRASMARLEKHGNKPRRHRQSPAGTARAADRRAAVRQQRRQHRRLRAGDRRAARLVRRRRRGLRHRRDDGPRRRVLRGAAEDRGVQRARPHRARGGAADVLVRQIVRPGADGDRGAGALAAQARRHDGRRGSGRAVGARGIARRRRPVAPRRRRREARPRHVRRRARPARAGGLRRDDPPHRHDHAQRRRSSRRTSSTR